MRGITRRSITVLVLVLVVISVASYGALAADWETSDLSQLNTNNINDLISGDLHGMHWADGGTRLYVASKGPARIYQLDAKEPYSINNLTLVSTKDHPKVNGPGDIELSPDGTKLFLVDQIDEQIERYTLSEAWNLSTATSSPDQTMGVVSNQGGFTFNDTGKEIVLITGQNSPDKFHIYSLNNGAYDISSTTLTDTVDYSGDGQDVEYGDNGTMLYVLSGTGGAGNVDQWDLPDAYNVSSLENKTSNNLPGISSAESFDWGPEDGRNVWVAEDDGDLHKLTTQNYTISGYVVDADGNGLSGASVELNTTGETLTTNSSGFYIVGVDNGTHRLNATYSDLVDNSTTVTVNGSSVTDANITMFEAADLEMEVTNHMFHNQTASVTVTDGGADVTDNATITSSDTDLITVSGNTLSSTANTSRMGAVNITATFDGQTVTKTVAVTDMSADSLEYQQDAARMLSAVYGDVADPNGDRKGGTQLTARIIVVAMMVGGGLSRELNGLAGVAGFGIVMTTGWFMGWVGLGMVLITGIVCMFVGLNTAQMRSRRSGPI